MSHYITPTELKAMLSRIVREKLAIDPLPPEEAARRAEVRKKAERLARDAGLID